MWGCILRSSQSSKLASCSELQKFVLKDVEIDSGFSNMAWFYSDYEGRRGKHLAVQ